jgi:DNA-binding MarR family transcriptional regulator
MDAALSLVHVHRLIVGRTEAVLRPLGLTFARYELLMLLCFNENRPLTVKELSETLQVHPTSVSSAVDKLEADQLVTRHRAFTDRRRVIVRITDQGRFRASEATAELNESVFANLPLTAGEGERLWSTIRSFRVNAGDFDGSRARTA